MNINPKKDAEVFDNVDDNYHNGDSGLFLFALSCTTYCIDSTRS